MFAPRLPVETIGRLWTMLAHNQGSVHNQARMASALGVANPTIDHYIDLLVDLQLVRRLRPWGGNLVKRAMAPSPEKGFISLACDDLQITQRYVVYSGTERFPLRYGAQAMGLQELATLLTQD